MMRSLIGGRFGQHFSRLVTEQVAQQRDHDKTISSRKRGGELKSEEEEKNGEEEERRDQRS